MKLCVTHCGGGKNPGVLPPQEMYTSPRINRFVKRCQARNVSWAILSAKYGLFFPEQRRQSYDVTIRRSRQHMGCLLNIRVVERSKRLGNQESTGHVKGLSQHIQDQIKAGQIDQIVFWYEARRPDAYIALLHYAVEGCELLPPGKDELEPHLRVCAKAGRLKLICDLDLIE